MIAEFALAKLAMPLIYRSPTRSDTRPSISLLWVWVILTATLWFLFRGTGSHLELIVDIQSPRQDVAQLFYDRDHRGYTAGESIVQPLHAGANRLHFVLPNGPIFQLRFDPVASTEAATISWSAVRLAHGAPWQTIALDQWKPLAATAIDRQHGMLALSQGVTADPQLQFVPKEPLVEDIGVAENIARILRAAICALFGALLFRWQSARPADAGAIIVPIGMAMAAGLILAMAMTATTERSVHPDEFTHLAAYQYYLDTWLPPAINDPATAYATPVWGYSYLFELDVVYDLAARLTAPLLQWTQDELRAARVFQFLLWLVLVGMAALRRQWAWTISAVFLSPQIWYVFAYFNADAFPLCVSLICAALIADPDGGVNRFLREGGWRRASLWAASSCIAMLLVSKRNYLPLVPVFLLWLAIRHLQIGIWTCTAVLGALLLLGTATFISEVPSIAPWWQAALSVAAIGMFIGAAFWMIRSSWREVQKRVIAMRLISFVFACVLIAAPRLLWDIHVNGWPAQRAAVLQQTVEARAAPDFKPSVIRQGKGDASVALALRGVTLKELIFSPFHWASTTFATAFGVYGYMNIVAPGWSYIFLSLLALSAFLLGVYGVRYAYPQEWRALLGTAVGGSILVLASSLLFSWVHALQAQGRYLFPIVAIAGLMIGDSASQLPKRLFLCLLAAAFVISALSFAFVALPAFAR